MLYRAGDGYGLTMRRKGGATMGETRRLGASGITVSALGAGTWSWGDGPYWGYGAAPDRGELAASFRASLDAGVTFFDTAELYGGGGSERVLGALARDAGRPVVIASKFTPYPHRLSPRTLHTALDDTRARLGVATLDLYLIHWPYTLLTTPAMMDALAETVRAGKVRAVGVCNFSATNMRRAHDRLARHGVPLAANEVRYNVLARDPETNGVLAACRELDVALIAHSPLVHGLLGEAGPVQVAGPRRFLPAYRGARLRAIEAMAATLREIARARDRTPAQVALNWLLSKDERIIPIPGTRRASHARANAGALGWRLTDEEIAAVDRASARVGG
ncbi:MAG TPA: aldo/keto reductase [Thermomicrobiales bacterium]|jgi:aryl-alcohol dehydrogenase-like predicted oxidoreductase